MEFWDRYLVFKSGSSILATDAYAEFNKMLKETHHQEWGLELFDRRFGDHDESSKYGIEKLQQRFGPGNTLSRPKGAMGADPTRGRSWRGLAWKQETDNSDTKRSQPELAADDHESSARGAAIAALIRPDEESHDLS